MGIFKSWIATAPENALLAALEGEKLALAHTIASYEAMAEDKLWHQGHDAHVVELNADIEALEARLAEIDELHERGDKLAA